MHWLRSGNALWGRSRRHRLTRPASDYRDASRAMISRRKNPASISRHLPVWLPGKALDSTFRDITTPRARKVLPAPLNSTEEHSIDTAQILRILGWLCVLTPWKRRRHRAIGGAAQSWLLSGLNGSPYTIKTLTPGTVCAAQGKHANGCKTHQSQKSGNQPRKFQRFRSIGGRYSGRSRSIRPPITSRLHCTGGVGAAPLRKRFTRADAALAHDSCKPHWTSRRRGRDQARRTVVLGKF